MEKEHIVHPFSPVYDQESRVLILGSFPSVISRKQNFYYANPHNRFWPVMEQLFNDPVIDKEAFCHKHHIALWDVIHDCTIKGSSDASITDVTVNDIASLLPDTHIQTIFTTGKRAGSLYDKYVSLDTEHINLPSTSSANASMHLEDLVESYRIVKEKCHEES